MPALLQYFGGMVVQTLTPESGGKPLAGEWMTCRPFCFGFPLMISSGHFTSHLTQERCKHKVRVIMALLNAAICIRNMLCSESLKLKAQFMMHLLSPPPWLIIRNQLYPYFYQPVIKCFILFYRIFK